MSHRPKINPLPPAVDPKIDRFRPVAAALQLIYSPLYQSPEQSLKKKEKKKQQLAPLPPSLAAATITTVAAARAESEAVDAYCCVLATFVARSLPQETPKCGGNRGREPRKRQSPFTIQRVALICGSNRMMARAGRKERRMVNAKYPFGLRKGVFNAAMKFLADK